MSRNANYSTLILLVLKELRFERAIPQGHLAQLTGKTPSAWSKIENGQTPLTTDVFFGACVALNISPSYVLSLVENLIHRFNREGFYFHSIALEDEDDLLILIQSYFNSPGYEALKSRPAERVSITAVLNPFAPNMVPTVLRYCIDATYKEWIDKGADPYPLLDLSTL